LFIDTKRGCSIPDLAEFYANCVVTNGVVTNTVSGYEVRFDAREIGELLGVSSKGFDVYVREDKCVLGDEGLLELTQRLAQKPHLTMSWSVRRDEMVSLHRLLFWFVIKNIIPRG